MFTQICSAALKTEANGRKAYSRLGFEPREHSANSFVHPEISAFGHFFYSEGGPVKRRDGKVVAFAKPSRKCEMEFTLPILEGCSSGHTEQDREVAEFKKVLGKTLGPERDLSDLNSRGVYIRGTGGGKRCIKKISATVWSD